MSQTMHQYANTEAANPAHQTYDSDELDDQHWNGLQETHAPPSDPSDAEMVDHAMDFIHKAQPVAAHGAFPKLTKPVAIPQVSPTLGAPFARAYAEVLQTHNIGIVEFVEFIDNFNILLTGSPPLTALSIVGQAASFVPVHFVGLAGTGLQLAAGAGKYAMVKTRCAHFVHRSNEFFFEPRGLKVKVLKTEHIAKICGVSIDDIAVRPLQPGDNPESMGPLDRRLQAVEGRVEHLRLDVPPPTEQSNVLAKVSAGESAFTQRRLNAKTTKNRVKAMEEMPAAPGGFDAKTQKELDKLDREEAKVRSKERKPEKIEKDMRKIKKERREVMEDAKEDKGKNKEKYLKDDKEIKKSRKGLWIVVFNKDVVEVWEAEEEKQKQQGPLAFLHRSKK